MEFILTQHVDFILIQYETCMYRFMFILCLIDFCNGRYTKSSILYIFQIFCIKMLPIKNNIPEKAIKAIDDSINYYTVQS